MTTVYFGRASAARAGRARMSEPRVHMSAARAYVGRARIRFREVFESFYLAMVVLIVN